MTVSVRTYLGFSETQNSASPHISTFSVPILDDNIAVNFYPEMTNEGLVGGVLNRIYFQVVSTSEDPEAKVNHIEFATA